MSLWIGIQDVVGQLVRRRRHLVDADDLCGVAALGFMFALRSWRRGVGYSFRSWAALQIRGRLRAYIDAHYYQRRCSGVIDVTAPPTDNALGHALAKSERAELRKVIAEARAELTPDQWTAIEGRLVRGLTLEQVAAETGSSRQAVHARYKKALPYLSERLRARLVFP